MFTKPEKRTRHLFYSEKKLTSRFGICLPKNHLVNF